MNKVLYIARRELSAYFNSPVAYVVVIIFLVTTGALYWMTYFDEINQLSMRGYFAQAPLFLAFFAPAITMGAFSREKREGTLELLMTMPIGDGQIVVGKFLAALALLAVVFVMTLPYPYSLSVLGELDWGAVAAGYVGMMLLGGAYAALGLMASSWTNDEVVALLIAFALCLLLFLVDLLIREPSATMTHIVEYSSTNYHFQNIARGVLDLRDLVYYVTLTATALIITTLSLGARRW